MQYWQTGYQLNQGKYVVEKILGSGGFGVTYKVKETRSQKPFAIKVLNPQRQQENNFERLQDKFINETIALASCRHPNIVRVYPQMFREAGLLCMVMDFIEGENLACYLDKRGVFSETEAIKLISQVGDALTDIHQQGLLHRDIKPGNILLRSSDLSPVLIDFGLAREYTPDASGIMTNTLTEGYAPIEQYENRGNFGAWTDVYALAATLYVLVTKEVPFPARFRKAAELPPPKQHNPKISNKLNKAILKGMAFEPENRPQSVKEWLDLFVPKPVEVRANQPKVVTQKPQSGKKQSNSFTQNKKVEITKTQVTSQKPKSKIKRSYFFTKKQKKAINIQPQVTSLNPKKAKSKNNLIKKRPFIISVVLLLGIGITQLYGWVTYYKFPVGFPILISNLLNQPLTGHSDDVNSVAYSPNGKYLASGSSDKTIKIWEVATGDTVQTFTNSGRVGSVAYSPDGKYLASESWNNTTKNSTIKIWEVATGSTIQTFTNSGDVGRIAYSSEGKYLAISSHNTTIKIWEIATGNIIKTLTLDEEKEKLEKYFVSSMVYSPEGKYLAVSISSVIENYDINTLIIWEVATGNVIKNLTFDKDMLSVAYSPNGQYLAIGLRDELRIWEVVTGRETSIIPDKFSETQFSNVIYSPDGKYIANMSFSCIDIWEVITKKRNMTLCKDYMGYSEDSFSYSSNGKYLAATFGADGVGDTIQRDKIQIWRVK